MDRCSNNTGRIIHLDAPGGTGKTFLINLLLTEIRAKQHIALVLASSGIAAILKEGRTANAALQLPLKTAEEQFPVCKISRASAQGELLNKLKLSSGTNARWHIKSHSKPWTEHYMTCEETLK
ncbi:unnamed protein product [Ceutorhynchus assimilis]|uniref:ATP-dependent DNA helicase n=1 Tax=Ceutorhynchus assimilis TaxID=467358 RepID=A0A9N9MD49_9CUCU|nr:unnamed protein product [Ceutorhynchus assimilis]